MTTPRIGLALGSGAARGWSHIGIIEALAEAGIEPDIVCGCSMGALVGAAHVAGELPALKDFAQSLTWPAIARMLDVRLSGGGLIAGQEIVAFLRKLKISAQIASYSKPFAAVATDLETGREIWLREGPIDEAVRASISIPGILSPARRADRWLVDGGLVNPVPVSVCRALGADVVIAVNLNGDLVGRHATDSHERNARSASGAPPELVTRFVNQVPPAWREQASTILPKLVSAAPTSPGYFEVLMTSTNVMQDQITRARLAGEPPHVMLVPRLRHRFNRAGETIAEGRAVADHALPLLRRYLRRACSVTPLPAWLDSLRVLAKIVSTLEQQPLARARPFLFGHVRSGIPVLQASRKCGDLAVLLLRQGRRPLSPDVLSRLSTARVG